MNGIPRLPPSGAASAAVSPVSAQALAVGGLRGPATGGGPEDVFRLDPVAALAELRAPQAAGSPSLSLAGQLLSFVAPEPRAFETLSPGRLLPLLDLALAHIDAARLRDEIDTLGAAALERELRDHRGVAEVRATLIDQ